MATDKMPDWLQTQLVNDGTMTADFITRKAKPRRCKKCHAQTLAAIDDLGLESHLDPKPTTSGGELLALLAGRATFEVIGTQVVSRDSHRVTAHPADQRGVFAAHSCNSPLPTNSALIEKKSATCDPARIPF